MNKKSYWLSISVFVLILIWTVYYYAMQYTGGFADLKDSIVCGIVGLICIVIKNDYTYIILGSIMAIVYWISFKNRVHGIEAYSVWASLFTLAVVMVTMKVSIKSTALEWVGKRVFSIYILQRIPM